MTTCTESIKVKGMICRRCEDIVAEALLRTRGVVGADASYWKGRAEVSYDPDIVSLPELEKAIDAAGYSVGGGGVSGIVVDIICLVSAAALVLFIMWIKASALPTAEAGASLGYVFLLGLFTSTHCVAMCGGIMLTQTTDQELGKIKIKRTRRGILASLSYNGGRVFSYTAAGAVFGAAGAVITYTVKIKSMVFTIAGSLVALIGLRMLEIIPGFRGLSLSRPKTCTRRGQPGKRFYSKPLVIGVLTGLMPCAPMQAMWLYSMSAGTAVSGALSMLIFALGTFPLMFVFGSLNSLISGKYIKYVLKAGAVLMLSLGVSMLISGVRLI